MNLVAEDFLWVEKYRPKTIDECVLPERIKTVFKDIVAKGQIPNMLLSGGPGVGKTTVAKALANELGIDVLVINASMDGNIDTLRNEIKQFASSVSLMGSGNRKLVILDEFDHANPNSFQPALRNFMEEYSKNCAFILTCNFKNRIIEPLHSRCSTVEFIFDKADQQDMARQFMARVGDILDKESVSYDKKTLAEVIMKYMPDWRKVLNELQNHSVSGTIDPSIFHNLSDESFTNLITMMKAKRYTDVRKWIGENIDLDPTVVYRKFYDKASELLEPSCIPFIITLIGKYSYQQAFVADQEINLAAALAEIMADAVYK